MADRKGRGISTKARRRGIPIASSGALRAGAAKIDITPDEPVYLGGYALRKEPARRFRGKLFVRALAFDDGRRPFVVMMADVIGMDSAEIRTRIAEAAGLDPECVFAGDVHNHSAPISRPRPKGADPGRPSNEGTRWFKHFHRAVVQVVRNALADLQPAKLGADVGASRVGMNRRKRAQGGVSALTFDENAASQSFGEHRTRRPVPIREFEGAIRLGANPLGPIDEEVGVLRVDTPDGAPLAVMVNYACHGTALGGRNATVCGDWIGSAMTALEHRLGAMPIYMQGAAGDINPRFVGGLDGYVDNLERTEKLGEEFAEEVVRVYGRIPARSLESPSIRNASRTLLLPRCYRELFQDFRNTAVEAPSTAVRIGDLTWVSFPGEMFHEIGRKVKRASPTRITFLSGYTNGNIGYFPTQAAFSEGGYEPATSHLDPTAEGHYLRQVADLMAGLR